MSRRIEAPGVAVRTTTDPPPADAPPMPVPAQQAAPVAQDAAPPPAQAVGNVAVAPGAPPPLPAIVPDAPPMPVPAQQAAPVAQDAAPPADGSRPKRGGPRNRRGARRQTHGKQSQLKVVNGQLQIISDGQNMQSIPLASPNPTPEHFPNPETIFKIPGCGLFIFEKNYVGKKMVANFTVDPIAEVCR